MYLRICHKKSRKSKKFLSSLRRYGRMSWTHVVKRTFWNVRCGIILFSRSFFGKLHTTCLHDGRHWVWTLFKVPRCSQSCPFPPWRAECIFSSFWIAFLGGPESVFWEMEKRIGNVFAPCLGGEGAGAGFWAPWLPTSMALGGGPPPRTMPNNSQYWTAHRPSLTRSLWRSEAYIVDGASERCPGLV